MNDLEERSGAYAGFLAMSADGTLGSVDETDASALASAVSDDPVVQTAVLASFYGSKMRAEMESDAREREASRRRMESDRRAAMFLRAGIDAEDAGRIAFDEMSGDPSPMLKVKERFFFC